MSAPSATLHAVPDARNFQVDLHGLVDLLSHHLYSSPRVYLRELLQNAADAITARRLEDSEAPAEIRIRTFQGGLEVHDTGIGLTADQVSELLATIGRSSKRDEIGFAREEFLGQFGIGMLSAFMVADEIAVTTKAAHESTTLWVGTADGQYTVTEAPERDDVGTTVSLTARQGAEQWVDPESVRDLALFFGSMLPVTITVNDDLVSDGLAPWDRTGTSGDRKARLVGYAQDELGFTPFDVIDLKVPAAGLDGVAFVLPFPANPAERATHRVYLKRMLLSESLEGLLPDWAFFVRCLVDTSEMRPTASREALYDGPHLEETKDALAEQLRGWLVRLGATDPKRLGDFLRIHQLGVKALALHDDAMMELVERFVPFETNQGRMTLHEVLERTDEIRYVSSVDEFRQIAGVAAAQGVLLVDAGYTYDADLLERLPVVHPERSVARFDPTELATSFDALDAATELALRPFVAAAEKVLAPVGCEVAVRAFDPPTLPVLYLLDRSAAFAAELRATRDKVDGLWAGVLGALDSHDETKPQLVLNHKSPLVRRLASLSDDSVVGLAVEGLYGHALMLGHHVIRPADSALVNRSFLGLLEQAVPSAKDSP